MKFLRIIWILPLLLLMVAGCKKDRFITDPAAALQFSTDTLAFDTVFTTIGSSTRSFKIFNPHSQKIKIEEIRLAGGNGSQFRINVDGTPGTQFKDLEIAAEDSMYVFVEVTVDPNNDNLPFIIGDSILFITNGNVQDINLTAYGQNAHFYKDAVVCGETWTNDKPYVLLGSVLVDTNCVLTIKEGVQVFVHAESYLYVAGTLKIEGREDTFVNFEGDRLEPFFDDLAGQWGGIIFLRGSKNNEISYARFNEAFSAIVAGSSTSSDLGTFTAANAPDVTLRQVEIKNCQEHGIFSFYSNITAENLLVHSTGKNNVALLFGGTHKFTHATLANYGLTGFEHKSPNLWLTNFAIQNEVPHVRPVDAADFTNCIIYGSIAVDTAKTDGEVLIDTLNAGIPFNYQFQNSLLRTNMDLTAPEFINTIKNMDPLFEDISGKDFSVKASSPANNAGTTTPVVIDLYGKMRSTPPDMGAIEKQ